MLELSAWNASQPLWRGEWPWGRGSDSGCPFYICIYGQAKAQRQEALAEASAKTKLAFAH